jgi:formate dehydrogenase subunit gamma
MTMQLHWTRALVATLMGCSLSLGLFAAGDAQAQATQAAPAATVGAAPEIKPDDTNAQRAKSQPGNNAPMWRDVRGSGDKPGVTTLPGLEKGVLIQAATRYPGTDYTTAGEAWRQIRNRFIIPYGGSLILISLLAVALFYFTKGPIGGHVANTGRKIERFTPFERAAHWTNAIAWVVLAVSGIVMAFGKFFLLPIIGGTLFGYLTYILKTMHNLVGPLFAVSLLIVIFTFARDNLPRAGDLKWLFKLGGMLSSDHSVPSHRFNAGEKVLMWLGVVVVGLTCVASGLVLDKLIPWIPDTRANMQVAAIVHGVSTLIMIAFFIGHIYMGTVGTRDAYQAMRTGYVDEGWAQEHHRLWADDVRAGKIPAQRSVVPGVEATTTLSTR